MSNKLKELLKPSNFAGTTVADYFEILKKNIGVCLHFSPRRVYDGWWMMMVGGIHTYKL